MVGAARWPVDGTGEGEPVGGCDRLPGSPEKQVETLPGNRVGVFPPEPELHPPACWVSAASRPLRARVAQLGCGWPRRPRL